MILRSANLISAWLAVWADPDDALELAFFTTGIGAAESVCVDGGAAAGREIVGVRFFLFVAMQNRMGGGEKPDRWGGSVRWGRAREV